MYIYTVPHDGDLARGPVRDVQVHAVEAETVRVTLHAASCAVVTNERGRGEQADIP